MACHLVGAKPLSEPMLGCLLFIRPFKKIVSEILVEIHIFLFKKIHMKGSSGNWPPFCRPQCFNLLHNDLNCFEHSITTYYLSLLRMHNNTPMGGGGTDSVKRDHLSKCMVWHTLKHKFKCMLENEIDAQQLYHTSILVSQITGISNVCAPTIC